MYINQIDRHVCGTTDDDGGVAVVCCVAVCLCYSGTPTFFRLVCLLPTLLYTLTTTTGVLENLGLYRDHIVHANHGLDYYYHDGCSK